MKKETDLFFEYSLWELLSNEPAQKKNITEQFLSIIQNNNFVVFISNGCAEKTNTWKDQAKEKFKSLVEKLKPIIIVENQEINELSDEYKKYGLFPSGKNILYKEIASASVNNIPAIVTVDDQDLIKYGTKIKIKGINQLLGYHQLEIISPEEL
ncbi:MAG: hypothetical protein PHX78_06175 [bacterium]|nr:hypothetical protein [bacterium]